MVGLISKDDNDHDAGSNRISINDINSKLVYYDWDGADRMKEVRSSDYGGWVCYYDYNAADQVVHAKRANNTITYHVYDAAGRLSQKDLRRATTRIDLLKFYRDEVGNPYQIYSGLGTGTATIRYFNYDQASRISKEAWVASSGGPHVDLYGFLYTYDTAGNRTIKKHTFPSTVAQYWEYDLADQLTLPKEGSATKVYFQFDSNGNLALEHDVDASAGRTYYDYDPRNLLARVDFPGFTGTNYFYYDAIGERIRKDDSTGGKLYTWDGIDVVMEQGLRSEAASSRYLKGYTPIAGIGAHVMVDPGGTGSKYFTHDDQVGTTIRLTNSTGATANTYRYDAWGQQFEATQAAGAGYNYRFNGKELDPDFVLFNSNNRRYHYPARSYTPFRGQFLQTDPMVLENPGDTYPRFAYPSSRPTIVMDPTGLDPKIAVLLWVAGCGACLTGHFLYAQKNYAGKGDKWMHCWVTCKTATHCPVSCAMTGAVGKEAIDWFCNWLKDHGFKKDGCGNDYLNDLIADAEGLICAAKVWRTCCGCC